MDMFPNPTSRCWFFILHLKGPRSQSPVSIDKYVTLIERIRSHKYTSDSDYKITDDTIQGMFYFKNAIHVSNLVYRLGREFYFRKGNYRYKYIWPLHTVEDGYRPYFLTSHKQAKIKRLNKYLLFAHIPIKHDVVNKLMINRFKTFLNGSHEGRQKPTYENTNQLINSNFYPHRGDCSALLSGRSRQDVRAKRVSERVLAAVR